MVARQQLSRHRPGPADREAEHSEQAERESASSKTLKFVVRAFLCAAFWGSGLVTFSSATALSRN